MISIATIIRLLLLIFSLYQRSTKTELNSFEKLCIGFMDCITWINERVCQQFTR